MTEDDAADGARDEADRVRGEGQEDGVELTGGLREEDLVEDDRRRGAVEEELVPLDDRARHRGGDHALEARGYRPG